MAVAIALGGGAPNLTLMTGALVALDEAGVDFKVITTTGAGMVAGLLYAAPRRESEEETWQQARRRSLQATREMGIDDLIYDQFPVNFKIFQKPGAMAEAYAHAVNPTIWGIPRETRRQRLLGDTLGLMAAAMQPATLTSSSQGLCQPPPWIELLVNFDELESNLEDGDKGFSLSAYCIEDQREKTFRKWEITAEHFKAGLAMPFLYSPYKLMDENGNVKTYLEGSAIRTMQFNPDDIMATKGVDTLIYFDLMGNRHLLAEPKNLIDAWGKSIVAPLTQLAYLQEQLVDLKRFAFSVVDSNTDIIKNYDSVTSKIEKLLREKGNGATGEVKDLIQEVKDLIMEAREGRSKLLEQAESKIKQLGKSFDESDHAATSLGDAAEQVEKYKDILQVSEQELEDARQSEEDEAPAFLRLENWLRYAGFTIDEMKKIATTGGESIDPEKPIMLRMPFRDHMPEEQWKTILDWSHSNMSTLFDIGYDTAMTFVHKHWKQLDLEEPKEPYVQRFVATHDENCPEHVPG